MLRPMVARPNESARRPQASARCRRPGSWTHTIGTPFETGNAILLALLDRPVKGSDGLAIHVGGIEAVQSTPRRKELGLEGIFGCPRKGCGAHIGGWGGWG